MFNNAAQHFCIERFLFFWIIASKQVLRSEISGQRVGTFSGSSYMLSSCLNTKMDCFIISVTIPAESVLRNCSERLRGFHTRKGAHFCPHLHVWLNTFQVLTYCVILLLDRVSYVLTIRFSGIWYFLVVMFLHSLETLRFHLSNVLQILPMFPSSPFNVLFQVYKRFKYFYLVPLHFACSLTNP